MKRTTGKQIQAVVALTALLLMTPLAAQQQEVDQEEVYRIANQVRKRILMLPNYGVFDSISFGMGTSSAGLGVSLRGYASRPTLKSSAENVVKKIEGVALVQNEIEVTPVGRMDDDIRLKVYRAIYFDRVLVRYNPNRGVPMHGAGGFGGGFGGGSFGVSNDPPVGPHPISIIVMNGKVILEGVVDTEGDKNIAGLRANGVSGVFSVTNNLQVINAKKKKKK